MIERNGIDEVYYDAGILEQKWDAKPRPFPYDTGSALSVSAHALNANAFGTAVKIIPKGTYDFGDSPNEIQIAGVSIELMDGNGVYLLEFLRETTPIGAIRFNRLSVQTRSFLYEFRGREVNVDDEDLYAQLKSTPANLTVTFSVLVLRHLSVMQHVETSTGVFPTG